jgi:hypothetical protein
MDGYYLKEVYPDIAVVSCDLYLEMDEDEIIDTTLKGLSKNDLSKSLLLVQFPRHGKVIFSDSDSDGKFKYVPHSNFNGIDSFYMSYQSNGIIIDTSLVEVRVKSKNDKPHMDALFLELLEDGQLKSDVDHGFKNYVLDPDDSVFQFEKLIEPKNGAFVLNLNGAYEYTPKLNLFGTDSVCISVSDLYSASDTCWIYFEVKSLNDRPFFNRDTLYFQINADSLFNLNLIITEGFVNDIDNRSNELKVKVKANPKNGKIFMSTDSTLKYDPILNTPGLDSFVIAIDDGVDESFNIPIIIRRILSNHNLFEQSIIIYPNPTNGLINIKLIEVDFIEIRDFSGKNIFSSKLSSGSYDFKFDLSAFLSGEYFVYLFKSKNLIGIKKILLQ